MFDIFSFVTGYLSAGVIILLILTILVVRKEHGNKIKET